MACTSLVELPLSCGSEGNMGGVQKLYIIAHKDLAPASGVAGTPIYTTAVNGMIDDIGLVTAKYFVEVGLLKSVAGLKETGVFNEQTGSAYVTQEFTLTLAGITNENRVFVESVFNQPVAIIVQGRSETPKFYAAGLNGLFKISAMEGGTGTAEADLNGYTLTFSGLDTKPVRLVETALITDLLEP